MFSGFTTWASGNAAASSTSQAVAEPSAQEQASNSKGDGARQTEAFAGDNELDITRMPIDPDVRAFQSTVDLDNRLQERAFEGRRAWEHVTLDDVAREMDDLKMDKDVDEVLLSDIQKSLETFIKATVTESKGKQLEKKVLTPARFSEIENRLKNDPSLQLADDDEDKAMNAPDPAAEVKKKMLRAYARIKKASYDLSQPTVNNIEARMDILRT